MKNRLLWISLGMSVLVLGMSAVLAFSGFGKEFARAELNVSNLTCGSCVQKIQAALAEVKGVDGVEVSVTTGRARVQFEPDVVTAEAIAGRIAAAGYPARVDQVLSPAEVKALAEDAARLADRYVARIGERLVARQEFAAEVGRLRTQVPEGQNIPESRLQQFAWQERVRRELTLADAEKKGVVVHDGEVALEVDRLRGDGNFASMVAARFGGEEALVRAVKEQMIVQRHLADNVLAGESDPGRRQAKLEAWYGEVQKAHPVTIFDPALKAAVETSGGCGCCAKAG